MLNHPLLSLSCWPLISVTMSTKLMQLIVSNSTVPGQTRSYIVRKQTLFLKWHCSVMKRKHISTSQWMKWKKVVKITRKYVSWQCSYSLINETFSCPCAYNKGIWQRGGVTPWITNPALLHTVPLDNIVATIISMLTFLLLHKILLAITWNGRLFH